MISQQLVEKVLDLGIEIYSMVRFNGKLVRQYWSNETKGMPHVTNNRYLVPRLEMMLGLDPPYVYQGLFYENICDFIGGQRA